jgi:crotonobetaine/carnitine-CoA ligase
LVKLSGHETIYEVFCRSAKLNASKPFLIAPANDQRSNDPSGRTISYEQALGLVNDLVTTYERAGFGMGHRVGVLLGNRLEYFLHKLAMNALGICCVPLNPDHTASEMAYVIGHSRIDLLIAASELMLLAQSAMELSEHTCKIDLIDTDNAFISCLSPAPRAQELAELTPESISTILYTSGTTGKPKGCLLSHRYELASGEWYVSRGGLATFAPGGERIYNPLPVFHVNAGILSFFGALVSGGCQIQSDRFHPTRWFQEIHETQATVVHYLGVVVPMLLNQPKHELERSHCVKFAIGAGVDPQRHAEFEARFGYPLIEIWGMTEIVRLIFDADHPRQVGTRSFGRPQSGLEVRVVDDQGAEVVDHTPGEMLIRHSAQTPRQDFFSGYLDDEQATEHAWRGGWFHTGDIVTKDASGALHFVERRKNIIRRSGENIAAAEVEAVLQAHPAVFQAAVLAVQDELREEEVLACIVLKDRGINAHSLNEHHPLIEDLLAHCSRFLAYYKCPGWIWVTQSLPTTGTQKIQKHLIFGSQEDPRSLADIIDIRKFKKRQKL